MLGRQRRDVEGVGGRGRDHAPHAPADVGEGGQERECANALPGSGKW